MGSDIAPMVTAVFCNAIPAVCISFLSLRCWWLVSRLVSISNCNARIGAQSKEVVQTPLSDLWQTGNDPHRRSDK